MVVVVSIACAIDAKVLEGHVTGSARLHSRDHDLVVLGSFGYQRGSGKLDDAGFLEIEAHGQAGVHGQAVALFSSEWTHLDVSPPRTLPLWTAVYRNPHMSCQQKLNASIFHLPVDGGARRELDVLHFFSEVPLGPAPRFVHLVALNCAPPGQLAMYYRVTLQNPPGWWSSQFSYEDQGVLQIHLVLLAWAVGLGVLAGLTVLRLRAAQLSHPPLLVLTAAIWVSALSRLLHVVFFSEYALHGHGPEGALVWCVAARSASGIPARWSARRLFAPASTRRPSARRCTPPALHARPPAATRLHSTRRIPRCRAGRSALCAQWRGGVHARRPGGDGALPAARAGLAAHRRARAAQGPAAHRCRRRRLRVQLHNHLRSGLQDARPRGRGLRAPHDRRPLPCGRARDVRACARERARRARLRAARADARLHACPSPAAVRAPCVPDRLAGPTAPPARPRSRRLLSLCGLFFVDTYRREPSVERLAFFRRALVCCVLWFAQMPITSILALSIPKWNRHHIATLMIGMAHTTLLAALLLLFEPERAKDYFVLTATEAELSWLTAGEPQGDGERGQQALAQYDSYVELDDRDGGDTEHARATVARDDSSARPGAATGARSANLDETSRRAGAHWEERPSAAHAGGGLSRRRDGETAHGSAGSGCVASSSSRVGCTSDSGCSPALPSSATTRATTAGSAAAAAEPEGGML